jgi:hypothetical protein
MINRSRDVAARLTRPRPDNLLAIGVGEHGQFRGWSNGAMSTSRLSPDKCAASRVTLSLYMFGLIDTRRPPMTS